MSSRKVTARTGISLRRFPERQLTYRATASRTLSWQARITVASSIPTRRIRETFPTGIRHGLPTMFITGSHWAGKCL
ncbi:MAG: hypothetical protein LBS20_11380 [Prevotella sp.]|nr:hypothetical protein [Prevotella sp.]